MRKALKERAGRGKGELAEGVRVEYFEDTACEEQPSFLEF